MDVQGCPKARLGVGLIRLKLPGLSPGALRVPIDVDQAGVGGLREIRIRGADQKLVIGERLGMPKVVERGRFNPQAGLQGPARLVLPVLVPTW